MSRNLKKNNKKNNKKKKKKKNDKIINSQNVKKNKEKRSYDQEIKVNALETYKNSSKTRVAVAEEFGIAYSTFCEWVKDAGINKKLNNPKLNNLERENLRLKLELADIKEEQEILKKYLAILKTM